MGDPPGARYVKSERTHSPSKPAADNHAALGPNVTSYAPPAHTATLAPGHWPIPLIGLTTSAHTNALYDRCPSVHPNTDHIDTWLTTPETHAASAKGNDGERSWLG